MKWDWQVAKLDAYKKGNFVVWEGGTNKENRQSHLHQLPQP